MSKLFLGLGVILFALHSTSPFQILTKPMFHNVRELPTSITKTSCTLHQGKGPVMKFLALPASVNTCRAVLGNVVKEIELPIRPGLSVFALEVVDFKALIRNSVQYGLVRPHCAVSWPASQAVAYALSMLLDDDSTHRTSQRKVFEIGAGNGVAGLCAAMMGANVTSTDIHPLALALVDSFEHIHQLNTEQLPNNMQNTILGLLVQKWKLDYAGIAGRLCRRAT